MKEVVSKFALLSPSGPKPEKLASIDSKTPLVEPNIDYQTCKECHRELQVSYQGSHVGNHVGYYHR